MLQSSKSSKFISDLTVSPLSSLRKRAPYSDEHSIMGSTTCIEMWGRPVFYLYLGFTSDPGLLLILVYFWSRFTLYPLLVYFWIYLWFTLGLYSCKPRKKTQDLLGFTSVRLGLIICLYSLEWVGRICKKIFRKHYSLVLMQLWEKTQNIIIKVSENELHSADLYCKC